MEERSSRKPPSWADNLLNWFIAEDLLEEVQGDLYEAFHKRCRNHGVRKARLLFIVDVLRSMSLQKMNNPFQVHRWSSSMFSNYFKSGWRNFLKYKSYSLINIFGLSIGFCSALLLFLIIQYKNSFDRFHSKADRIYRVGNGFTNGNYDDVVVTPQVPLMQQEYPEIVRASRFHGWGEDIIGHNDTFVRSRYHVVDTDFGEMFDFAMVSGDLRKALASPNQIVLTRSKAVALFGDEEPIGKSVRFVNEKIDFTVAAIAEDPPKNSSLQFEALIPWANAPEWLDIDQAGNWYNTFMEGYVELAPGASKEALEHKLVAFKDTHFLEERRATWRVILLPLAEEHSRQAQNKGMLTILGIIAGAILLISCINFTNLSIAQSLKRTKEVGLRRVLGSLQRHVTIQFMMEGMITCAISLLVGIGITWAALPYINQYYDFGVSVDLWQQPKVLVFILCIGILPGVFASIGPAVALAGLKPVYAIKGIIRSGLSGEGLRRSLIVLQFTASIILLIGTAVIWQQTQYMKSQDLKLDHANVVAVEAWSELFKDPEKAGQALLAFRNELEKESAIETVSFVSDVPGAYSENYNGFSDADEPVDKTISLRQTHVDHNFFRTFDMRLVMGRNFSPDIEGDKHSVIINQSAMKAFGWTDINNKEIIEGGGKGKHYSVIGVVEDYYYQSLRRTIQPLAHFYRSDHVGQMVVRLKAGRIEDGLAVLRSKWAELGPYEAFNYRFVDKSFDNLYKEQDRLSATCSLFSVIAVAISSLGLFSITAYSIRLRRREVSIRKVLGASVSELVLKLSGAYSFMVIIGFLLACPIAYYLTNTFLAGFAYKVNPSPLIFGGVGIIVLVLALFIVGSLSGKAALENPVDALKDE
ncbi:MAG TPA: ABC transporter permease [Chryseosolibacter sp.]|nr:ABC transporter permease [Chryseosolibacter sp.]